MSVIELIGDWLQSLAGAPPAPGDPGAGLGAGAGPAAGGGAGGPGGDGSGGDGSGDGGSGGDGPGGDGPGGDGPPTLDDLWESAKKAAEELVDIGDEVIRIGTSKNRTADEQIVWDAAGPNVVDVGVGVAGAVDGGKGGTRIPGAGPAGTALEAAKYGEAGAKAVTTVTKATKTKTDAADAAYNESPSRQNSSSSDSSGDGE